MSIKRGDFVLVCNSCGKEVDLETDDFNTAVRKADEHKEENEWTTVQRGGRYVDICEDH